MTAGLGFEPDGPNAQARTVLAASQVDGSLPMCEASIGESRQAQWAWTAFMGEREPVARVQDRFIATPTAEIPIRIYTPDGHGPFPALVAFHGGCWIVGNIEVSDRPHRNLANALGCVVVAVNYQKAPEHPFPVPLDDCYAGFAWTVRHAEELDIDPGRIGVAGDSAGGNLAACVCIKARDGSGPLPSVQVLIYPAVDPNLDTWSARHFAEGYGLSTRDMEWSWRQYVEDPALLAHPLVSPIRAESLAGLPPAVVVTAGFDVLRDEGLAYADRLEEAGVAVRRLAYDGTIHGFMWMRAAVEEQSRMLRDLASALEPWTSPARSAG
jgi:acetyl esterase